MMPARRRILSVVGTRPNFMKIAPIARVLAEHPTDFEHVLVHTGQHYDETMSDVFFGELSLPQPDVFLGVGSGTRTEQTVRVMSALEPVLRRQRPDVVLVPGDVTSTLAAALTVHGAGIPLGHVEAGLRSFDRSMPEELNRVITDQLSDLLLIHSPEARDHLLAEGRPTEAIHMVGNTMIDTLVAMRELIDARDAADRRGLGAGEYVVVTLHRPALVDGALLPDALAALATLSDTYPVVFPVHPRTRERIAELGVTVADRVHLLEPLGYLDFLALMRDAAAVLTDSGGIQEETTYLGVPCFTLRDNTERPITLQLGTNALLGLDPARIVEIPALLAADGRGPSEVPPYWDGRAAERIVALLAA
jgi:UDP-N-acetylglucosamine 2-epimerase (non-hydrolysing)